MTRLDHPSYTDADAAIASEEHHERLAAAPLESLYRITTTEGEVLEQGRLVRRHNTARGAVLIFEHPEWSLGAVGLEPEQIAQLEQLECAWYVLCTNAATVRRDGGPLGPVPTCSSCNARADQLAAR